MELVVRGNKWFTIGEGGAEMRKIKKGDIVFNNVQTEQILNNGYVTANGGRGRVAKANGNAHANGNAYKNGTAYVNGTWGGGHWNIYTGGWSGGSITGGSPTINYSPKQQRSSSESTKEFRETVDYITILIDRLERKIDELDTIAGSAYRSFEDRNKALGEGFAKITEEIEVQQKAYDAYMNRANQVGLGEDIKQKIRDGALEITDYTDENTYDAIQEYQDFVEKAYDARDAVTELQEALSEIMETQFDQITDEFDGLIEGIDHEIEMLEGQLDIIENRGQFAGAAYYEELMKQEQKNMDELQEKYVALQDARNEAIWSGTIKEGSEAWYDMESEINDVAQAWQDAQNSLIEYKNEMWEVDWERFEYGIGIIDNLITESEFLRDVLAVNENDLFNKDTGRFTDAGWTSGALMAQDYNAYMAEADAYAQKILEINDLLANDPNNTILLDQKNEYIEAQQEAINAANEEKQAIQSLYEDAFDKQLKILSDLIDKRKEMLEAEKDSI